MRLNVNIFIYILAAIVRIMKARKKLAVRYNKFKSHIIENLNLLHYTISDKTFHIVTAAR